MKELNVKKYDIIKAIHELFEILNEDDLKDFENLIVKKMEEKQTWLNEFMDEYSKKG